MSDEMIKKKKGGECMDKYAAGGVAKLRLGQSTKDGKQKECKGGKK